MNREDLKEGVYAGLIAGLFFLVIQMLLMALYLKTSPWVPPRMISAMILGKGILSNREFNLGIVLLAGIIHFSVSILYSLILVFLIRFQSLVTGTLIGVVFGLVLYFIHFYGFAMIFPWFAEGRNVVNAFAHMVFGGVSGFVFKELQISYHSKMES
ncbi:hypothetical protein Deipe_3886 [Sporocytophaga myxococcoides]|uniref:Sodium:proline symporter n=1 Tax=Sporocytophaga myxococcoides TaxID=153721 RepID=A0A098LEG5_9BACT|nr:hypothetical protein [Sporocytophaga myxococcoides]GAL85305.1 hypothetical protein Deipe_3886 [Sporocytophaga myxococcoides]